MSNNNFGGSLIQDGSLKLSAKEMFFKYLVYLPLFILSLGVTITIAYIYMRYKVPIFSSTISILIKDGRSGSSDDNTLLDDVISKRRSVNLANEIEMLKTASMMERVVRKYNLNVQYFAKGKVKQSEIYNNENFSAEILHVRDSSTSFRIILTANKDGIVAKYNGKTQNVHYGVVLSTSDYSVRLLFNKAAFERDYEYSLYYTPVEIVAASLAGTLGVRQLSRESTVLVLSVNTENPEKGRDVLNGVAAEYRQMNIEDKNKVVENTIKFIDDRLMFITRELGEVEGSLQNYKQRSQILSIEDQGTTEFGDFKAAKKNMEDQAIQLQVIDFISNYLENPSKKFELVPSSLGIADATLNTLIQAYNSAQLSRYEQLKTVSNAHPSIRVQEEQIEKLRISILENLRNIRAPQQNLANKFKQDYEYAFSKIKALPQQQRDLVEIMRQQGIKEKLYLFLLQKREESAITRASATGNSFPLDAAVSSASPVSPNTSNIYRLAFIIGIIVPVAFIYLRDLLNDKVITRTDLTKSTATPIIGEIAHHASMARKFVVGMRDRSILAEQFRIIRTNLQFLLTQAPSRNPVILVTSTIAGEGKTFTSMNMAAVWAVAGKKTVILELDLRKPKISKALGLQRDTGISNYILGNARKEDLPQPNSEVPNLYIIGAGPIPPNPSEMIMDNKMDELFTYLRANFDIVIIDSAPVGLVSDSKILARFADATIYVVRQRYTIKKQIAFIDDLYTNAILPNMGIVVNDVKIGGANSYYGYGYGYGYGSSYNYNYSYSYGEKDKRTFVQKVKDMVGL